MGRWSQYDEDDYRLPQGVKRVGYDADTQTYTYQDADGSYWEGDSGCRYGTLNRVGTRELSNRAYERPSPPPAAVKKDHDDVDDDKITLASRLFTPFLFLRRKLAQRRTSRAEVTEVDIQYHTEKGAQPSRRNTV